MFTARELMFNAREHMFIGLELMFHVREHKNNLMAEKK
jgi:hypothetical protein